MANIIPNNEIFGTASSPKSAGSIIQLKGSLPGEGSSKGDMVNATVKAQDPSHSRTIVLKKKLAEGGEGSVYTTSLGGFVAKVYRRDKLTTDRKDKLKLMITRQLSHKGICFPVAMILNEQGEFVGYLMREASGHELGRSIFQPQLFLQKFPNWNRRDSIDLCLTILDSIKFLNDRNVILGDINPANILVKSPREVYFVDCDSYQVEGYPCPVGTANFTPPEAQGKNYKSFLRTQTMENFSIATLLFMILLPGKPPYSAVGGASPEKNIRNGVFPYPHKETDTDKTPPGKWGYIWSHMSYKMRLAFFENFKKGEKHFLPQNRYSTDQWIEELKDYRYAIDKMIENDPMALDVFPTREKMKKCKKCGKMYVPNRDNYTPYCSSCDTRPARTYSSAPRSSSYGTPAPVRPSNTKLCPYCGQTSIPNHWNYCNNCRNKTVKMRECVNCHKSFPVTASLDTWEKQHGAIRKQCDVCKAAGCTADPCRHALQAASKASPGTSKITGTQTATNKQAKPQKSGCYIATAVYGSYYHPHTYVLRQYRDNVLSQSIFGRAFIKVYYKISPGLVRRFGKYRALSEFTRHHLDKFVDHIQSKYGFHRK